MLVTSRNSSVVKVSVACKQESFQKKKTGLQHKFNFVLDTFIVLKSFITKFYTINKYTDSCPVQNIIIVINHYPQGVLCHLVWCPPLINELCSYITVIHF